MMDGRVRLASSAARKLFSRDAGTGGRGWEPPSPESSTCPSTSARSRWAPNHSWNAQFQQIKQLVPHCSVRLEKVLVSQCLAKSVREIRCASLSPCRAIVTERIYGGRSTSLERAEMNHCPDTKKNSIVLRDRATKWPALLQMIALTPVLSRVAIDRHALSSSEKPPTYCPLLSGCNEVCIEF